MIWANEKRAGIWMRGVILVFAVVLCYSNSFQIPFIYDDKVVLQNYMGKSLLELLTFDYGTRPLFNLTVYFNLWLGALDVWTWHAFNLLVHLAAALTLFDLVRRVLVLECVPKWCQNRSGDLAFFASLLWALHPLHTQAVTYISQRCESMMGLFCLLGAYCLVRGAAAVKWRHLWYFAAIIACLFGFGSKETMVSAPFVLFLLDRSYLSKSVKESFYERRVFYGGLVLIFIVALFALISRGELMAYFDYFKTSNGVTPLDYLFTQSRVILHYLRLTLWPDSLCFDYFWASKSDFWMVAPAFLVTSLLFIASWALFFKWPIAGFPLLWFWINLAPRSSLLIRTDAAVEYRMYLPLAGLAVWGAIVLVYLAEKLASFIAPENSIREVRIRRDAAAGVLMSFAMVLAYLTFQRNFDYRDGVTLWRDTLDKAPHNIRAMNYLGIALAKQGEHSDAKALFEKVAAISPTDSLSRHNLGAVSVAQGRLAEAKSFFQQALLLRQNLNKTAQVLNCDFDSHRELARVFAGEGNLKKALEHYRYCMEIRSDDPYVSYELGVLLMNSGDLDEARKCFIRAFSLKPDYPNPYNEFALTYFREGNLRKAEKLFHRAISIDPRFVVARLNLSLLLSKTGRVDEALRELRICAGLAPNDPRIPNLMAKLTKGMPR